MINVVVLTQLKQGGKIMKQVQLSKTTNEQLEAICLHRLNNNNQARMKKHVVADAIALLYKRELK